MKTIGVVAALPGEGRCLTRTLPKPDSTRKVNDHLLLRVSGMGRENARAAAQALVREKADLLISWGVAAALDDALRAGDLILANSVVDNDGRKSAVHPDILRTLTVFSERARIATGTGMITTTDQVLYSPAAKQRLQQQTGAIAADMESAAVAAVAAEAGVGFLPVRVISDDRNTTIPASVTRNMDAQGKVRVSGLLFALFCHPGDIRSMLALARGFKRALATLVRCAGFLRSAAE